MYLSTQEKVIYLLSHGHTPIHDENKYEPNNDVEKEFQSKIDAIEK